MTDSSDDVKKPGVEWADPSVPVGTAPTFPHWPLVVAVLVWLAWVAFLVAMML